MNNEIKEWWCDALESGEYEQGQGQLHCSMSNTFCCLGVLTDIYIKKTGLGLWNGYVFVPMIENEFNHKKFKQYYLPEEVAKWAEIPIQFYNSELQIIVFSGVKDFKLAHENDENKLSFKDIAKLIREADLIKAE